MSEDLQRYGKIPPQAVELEQCVLGSLMAYQNQLNDIRDILKPESFYKENHQLIFNAILKLDSENKEFDSLMVINQLKKTEELEKIGGAYYFTELTELPSGIQEKSLIIQEKYLKRELIRISSELHKKSFDETEDVFDIISDLSSQTENLLKDNSSGVEHISDCVTDVMNVIDNNIKGIETGVPSGFKEYDKFTRGEQQGDLVIIAGETSQGKTALALCKAFNQALMGYNVAIFSYEMSKNQITARLMALATEFSAKRLLMDKLESYELEAIFAKTSALVNSNIYIIEVERNNYNWLKNKIKTIKSKYNIDSVIIDYVQLITVDNLPRNQQVGHIANNLKFLAKHKNINIPITLLSQLKRSERPEPSLSRLKESGDIENAADIVIGIWRPEHYQIENIDIWNNTGGTENINTSGVGIMQILKGRNTGLKTFIMNWTPELTRYQDYISNKNVF